MNEHIKSFIKNVIEENYAAANKDLSNSIELALLARIAQAKNLNTTKKS
jgi:hypothetical protein